MQEEQYRIVVCRCGKEFMTKDGVEACPKCSNKINNTEKIGYCAHCRTKFTFTHAGTMYCSRKCSDEARKKYITCKTCGKTFKGSQVVKYCSVKCRPIQRFPILDVTCVKCGKIVRRKRPIKYKTKWLCESCRRDRCDRKRSIISAKSVFTQSKVMIVLENSCKEAMKNHEHVPWLTAKEILKRTGVTNTEHHKFQRGVGAILSTMVFENKIIREKFKVYEGTKLRSYYHYQIKA